MFNQEQFNFDNTRFIFATNFSGDPKRDNFGDTRRKVNLIIPTEELAKALTKAGINVRQTKPGKYDTPEDFVPEFYTTVIIQFRKRDGELVKYPPAVHLVPEPGAAPVKMSEETVGQLDFIRVKNVNCIATVREYKRADGTVGHNLQTRVMYVEQDMDQDPYAAKYARKDELDPESEPDDTL